MTQFRIVNDEEYAESRIRTESTFDLSCRFPDQVFRRSSGHALFCEYESVLGSKLWPAIRALALHHGDDEVFFLSIEPDSESYYRREYGAHAAFSLDISASAEDYWGALVEAPGDDMTGAIAFSANVVAITGKSTRWGCWGERALGIAVFQSLRSDIDGWRAAYGPFWSAREALERFMAPNFQTAAIPSGFTAAFTKNY